MTSHLTNTEQCQACREGIPDYIAPCCCPTEQVPPPERVARVLRGLARQMHRESVLDESMRSRLDGWAAGLLGAADLLAAHDASVRREAIGNQRQALADLITRHEAHDGRIPACQLRTVLGMPARDRGEL